jgi:hypothetical protein
MTYGNPQLPPRLPNAEAHDGRAIAALTYRVFFVGTIWRNVAKLAQNADALATALDGALQDDRLNQVFAQYLPKGAQATARPILPKTVIERDWPSVMPQSDLLQQIEDLLVRADDPRIPSDTDFGNFVVLFVLPPNTILGAPQGETANSLRGLAAYHDRFVKDGRTIYYAVAAWSDGQNGGAKPGWEPWQNTCAALYHEIAEVRTNPDIGKDAPDRGWFVDIPPDHMLTEVADLPIMWAGQKPHTMMQEVALQNGTRVPIQLIWSNAKQKPWDPTTPVDGPPPGNIA